jgi:serpin B
MRHWPSFALALVMTGAACAPNRPIQESAMPASADFSMASAPTPAALKQLSTSGLVAAQNQFALKLLQATPPEDGNLALSPLSAALALTMTLQGASGSTQAAMQSALQLNGFESSTVLNASRTLRQRLAHLGKGLQVTVANGLFSKADFEFAPAFLKANRDYFGAQAQSLDFSDPAAVATVNTWVKEATAGKIDQLLQSSDLNALTLMVLLNAIYFKGTWSTAFDPKLTVNKAFMAPSGERAASFMVRQGEMGYLEVPGVKGVSLPYGKKGAARFYAFLPDQPVAKWLQTLTLESLNTLLDAFQERSLRLEMPRFKLETSADLKAPLTALGMGIAFDEARADFQAMLPQGPDAYLAKVRQKTFVEVNEQGTEAAAVTAVVVATRSAVARPLQLALNRPFLFLIRDETTGSLLFTGMVSQP